MTNRLLRPACCAEDLRGISTTQARTLLKRQSPVRTFADWNDAAFQNLAIKYCPQSRGL
jgi:hypothetical protein